MADRLVEVASRVLLGIARAVAVWLLYYLLGAAVASTLPGAAPPPPGDPLLLYGFAALAGLGVLQSAVRGSPLTLVASPAKHMLGMLILFYVTGGGVFSVEAGLGEATVRVELGLADFLTAAFTLIAVPMVLLDAYEYLEGLARGRP